MKIATFNINGVKDLSILLRSFGEERRDGACLQEIRSLAQDVGVPGAPV